MSSFTHLVRFESEEDGRPYYAELGSDADGPPAPGTKIAAATTVEGLMQQSEHKPVTIRRVRVVRGPEAYLSYLARVQILTKIRVATAAGASAPGRRPHLLCRAQLLQPRQGSEGKL